MKGNETLSFGPPHRWRTDCFAKRTCARSCNLPAWSGIQVPFLRRPVPFRLFRCWLCCLCLTLFIQSDTNAVISNHPAPPKNQKISLPWCRLWMKMARHRATCCWVHLRSNLVISVPITITLQAVIVTVTVAVTIKTHPVVINQGQRQQYHLHANFYTTYSIFQCYPPNTHKTTLQIAINSSLV